MVLLATGLVSLGVSRFGSRATHRRRSSVDVPV